jgi:hypothetical protein
MRGEKEKGQKKRNDMTRDLQAKDEKEGMAKWNKNNAIEDLLNGWYDEEYDEERLELSD